MQSNFELLGRRLWQHYVPAVCGEINQRAEFISSYGAEAYTDHGKYQEFFEYASLFGELAENFASRPALPRALIVFFPIRVWGEG